MRLTLWAVLLACLAASQVAAYTRDEDGKVLFSPEELNAMMPEKQRRSVQGELLAMRAEDKKHAVARRSNPSGTYGPSKVACPPLPKQDDKNYPYTGYIRNALNNKIGPQEQDYMNRHREKTRPGWQDWLSRAQLDGNGGIEGGVSKFLESGGQPQVGIAISGGGYRAMLHGLGVVQGFDGRNETSKQRGVGGLLQIVDYVAGLSGGSWATGSMAINDWPTTQQLLDILNLENNLVFPEDGKTKLYIDLFRDTDKKKEAGFPTSITDLWGRALSYHLLNQSTYPKEGQATTFSDIVNVTHFKDASYPFPIALAIGRQPGELMINPNATYFEWTPYEFGTWQPSLEAFIPVGSLGSKLQNGQVDSDDKQCIAGYENFGFAVGSSSTLFNAAYLRLMQSKSKKISQDIVKSIFSDMTKENNDVAAVPNPFKGYKTPSKDQDNKYIDAEYIDLVDGGEANQNLPLDPLYQPSRQLDLVIAVDGSGDVSNWPNGSGIVETQKRMNLSMFKNQKFPKVPDMNTIVNQGLNTRPTFFGCTPASESGDDQPAILVYLANYPYSYFSNTSTFQLEYNVSDAQRFVDNSVDVATMEGKMDDWHTCLACATLQRKMQRKKTPFPDKCNKCFEKYCWNGKTNTTTPGNFTPAIGTPEFVTSNGKVLAEPPVTGSNKTDQGIDDMFGLHGNSATNLMTLVPHAAALAALTALAVSLFTL